METMIQTSRAEEVLSKLLLAHEAYYDVTRNAALCGREFDGHAAFESSTSRYVLVKRAKLWEANVFEHILFDRVPSLTEDVLNDYLAFVKERLIPSLHIGHDHMTTYVSLVFIADQVSEEMRRTVAHTRYRKNIMGGLRGWIDVRLAVIDLDDSRVITNPQGKVLRRTLEHNAFANGQKEYR